MRPSAIILLTTTFLAFGSVSGGARADTRSDCIVACEATAQTCLSAAHATYEACKPAARTTCAREPAAALPACLGSAARTCSANHSAQTEPCRVTFTTCYAACGAAPATQVDFWCELNADATTGTGKTYKEAFCAGTPGQPAVEQHNRCMKRLTPADPAVGFSLDCNPLR